MTLDYAMVQSQAWRTLSGSAKGIWIELRSRYNGKNNGHLRLSYDEGTRQLALSKTTVYRAFKELQERGFVKLAKAGDWYGRLATEWEITSLPRDGKLATRDFNHWRPDSAPSADPQKQSLGTVAEPSSPVLGTVAEPSAPHRYCSGTVEGTFDPSIGTVAERLYSTRGPGRARGG